MIWPVDVRTVTQEFAAYPNPDYQPDGHTGMDFGVNVGTPIRAAGAGTVLWADWAQGLGWPNPYYIAIDFDGPSNGDQSAGIVVVIDHGHCATLYAHLDHTGLNPGDKVREGEIIGQTGNTGRSSGPHLYFEVLPDGWNVYARWYGRTNPRNVISGHAAIAPQSTTTKKRIFQHMTPKEEAEVLAAARRINRYLDAPIGVLPRKVADALLDEPVVRARVGGKTSLRSTIAYLDTNLNDVKDAATPKEAK